MQLHEPLERAIPVQRYLPLTPDTSWHSDANCRDVPNEVMMPEPTDPYADKRKGDELAKQICHGCPVKQECLDTFLDYGGYGIWAGKFRGMHQLMAMPKRVKPRITRGRK